MPTEEELEQRITEMLDTGEHEKAIRDDRNKSKGGVNE